MFTILFTQVEVVLTIILIFVNEKLINHIKNFEKFFIYLHYLRFLLLYLIAITKFKNRYICVKKRRINSNLKVKCQ